MRLAPTYFVNLFRSSLLYSDITKTGSCHVGTPAVAHERVSRATFCTNAQLSMNRRLRVWLTGTASMDHLPSPINLLFSVLIKAILDAAIVASTSSEGKKPRRQTTKSHGEGVMLN